MQHLIIGLLMCWVMITINAQSPLITDILSRAVISLNGLWQYIIDPYGTGFYDYRWKERSSKGRTAYWSSDIPDNKTERKEHGYAESPGDWNFQDTKFLYYGGIVWCKRSFDLAGIKEGESVFLYFDAVNYECDVYLNG